MRTISILTVVVLVLALAVAVASVLAARHFYFRAKLAAAEPVAFGRFASENAVLRDSGKEHPRIVLIGDSRVRAMRLNSLESRCEMINRGINGETTAQMSLRFEQDALGLKPDVIVIQSGMNDLVAGMASDSLAPVLTRRVIENLKEMAARAAVAGAKVIVLNLIPPARPPLLRRLVWRERIRDEVAAVNAGLESWNPPDGVRVLDVAGDFGMPVLQPRYALDTLHLNESAYARIESVLAPAISMHLK